MKKQKGFTLIELLAVIVILAVIALIATPLIMSTINDAKEGALKSTVRAIKEEAEKLYVQKVQSNPSAIPVITEDEIEYSGDQIPLSDMKVTYNSVGLANIAVYKDNKCVYKKFYEEDVTLDKTFTKEDCLKLGTITGADSLIDKANSKGITNYKNGNKGEMYAFNQPVTEQLEATTDYRYIGATPNNYIEFNGETWRIIGVFGNSIKIIRDGVIEWMPRDYKKGSSANPLGSSISEYGSNDWTDSQLMYFLNPTTYSLKQGYTLSGNYIKDTHGNIIYEMGKQPALVEVDAIEYTGTANAWLLNEESLALVTTTIYYLGGISKQEGQIENSWGNGKLIYQKERSTNVYTSRPTNWTGKVGLMYPSDYVYTFAKGVEDNCYANAYECTTDNSATPSSSWLYISDRYQWTISPYAYYSGDSLSVYANGGVVSDTSRSLFSVRPTVYLRSDVLLTGTGTEADPYKIVG